MKATLALCAAGLVLCSVASAQRVAPPDILPIPPPRIELLDSSASPMQVAELSVSASVRGLFAAVETTLVFRNPNPRLLEGDLVFPLPDGAAVCGYALDVNGVLVDGVVVKKEKARVAFESETRRRVDPGLVEHVKGNLYRTRIYPLPPNGVRTVRLAYSSPLALAPNGDAALFLPLPRESIGKLSVKIEVANENAAPPELGGLGDRRFELAENVWRVESSSSNAVPAEDVFVALPKLPASTASIERSGDDVWFSVSAIAPAVAGEGTPPSRWRVLWDASGSRSGANLDKEFALLANLGADRFSLVVFRDAPEPAREFESAADLVAALKETPFDGGSDFAALAESLPDDDCPALLFSDGVDTLSGRPLEFAGAKPFAVVSQTLADREALRQACSGALVDLQTLDAAQAAKRILSPAPRIVGLKGTGVADVQGLGRPALGRVSLLGRLVAPEAAVRIEFAGGVLSDPFVLRAADARDGKNLATAWAAARVQQLSPRADQFEDELLALGRKYGIVGPATSLIVLESLDQWVRHEIEPPASLPQMREQYFAAMKGRSLSDSQARSSHLDQLASLWKRRLDWWNNDFVANPVRPPVDPPVVSSRRSSEPMVNAFPMLAGAAPASPPPLELDDVNVEEMPEPVEFERGETIVHLDAVASPVVASRSAPKSATASAAPVPSVQIKEWSPDVPYLKPIRAAKPSNRYDAYLAQRAEWAQSPAFFLDCAEEFFRAGDRPLGLRVLSNLAELKIEDSALLRVFAWRLRQAADLDRSVVLLRRVAKLRAEEPQSFRDLALALADRGQANRSKADLEEAAALFAKVAFNPWNRHSDSIPLFALEELNALADWIDRQEWKGDGKPSVPERDEKFLGNLDVDLRIVMSWNADATDIDLHVLEPGGEEAFYGRNLTSSGGLVSRDVTDGYGPEEYLVRKATPGNYSVKAKYYGSSQQTLVGPATVSAAVFTDWGRPGQSRQNLTLRLDKPHEIVEIGSVSFGKPDNAPPDPSDFSSLRLGMSPDDVLAALGEPSSREDSAWLYVSGNRTVAVRFGGPGGALDRVAEILPGGIENVVIQ